jgi:hypothetical protein
MLQEVRRILLFVGSSPPKRPKNKKGLVLRRFLAKGLCRFRENPPRVLPLRNPVLLRVSLPSLWRRVLAERERGF